MDDLISRQAVLDHIYGVNGLEGLELSNVFEKHYADFIKSLPPVTPQYTEVDIQKMQDLESAEIQKAYEIGKAEGSSEKPNKWIPVSEKYPTGAHKRYLVCYEDGCITIEYLYFDGDGNPFFSEMELGVVAWMPLPEPYKQEVEE